jgi:polysaccharide export outer membrane protein
MQAIALAGGPVRRKTAIQVRRRGAGGDETIFVFNYKAYEAGADLEGNIRLRAGDVIMVPERGLFD